MGGDGWWTSARVREALSRWDNAQRALDAIRPAALPADLTELDELLTDGQVRAQAAWQEYESAREEAGGPQASASTGWPVPVPPSSGT
jgi:hypothetical protein